MTTAINYTNKDTAERFRVVTVARTFAAGGEEVALTLARSLGFRYVDDQIVVKAAEAAGVSPDVIDRAEHGDPGLTTMLWEIATRSRSFDENAVPELRQSDASAQYGRLIQRVIERTADEGSVVIVAHGAGIHLSGRRDTLRVLITGSVEGRAARLAGRLDIAAPEALRQVETADMERRDFLRRFYSIDEETPAQYDIVLNTDALSRPKAARLIVNAVAQ